MPSRQASVFPDAGLLTSSLRTQIYKMKPKGIIFETKKSRSETNQKIPFGFLNSFHSGLTRHGKSSKQICYFRMLIQRPEKFSATYCADFTLSSPHSFIRAERNRFHLLPRNTFHNLINRHAVSMLSLLVNYRWRLSNRDSFSQNAPAGRPDNIFLFHTQKLSK